MDKGYYANLVSLLVGIEKTNESLGSFFSAYYDIDMNLLDDVMKFADRINGNIPLYEFTTMDLKKVMLKTNILINNLKKQRDDLKGELINLIRDSIKEDSMENILELSNLKPSFVYVVTNGEEYIKSIEESNENGSGVVLAINNYDEIKHRIISYQIGILTPSAERWDIIHPFLDRGMALQNIKISSKYFIRFPEDYKKDEINKLDNEDLEISTNGISSYNPKAIKKAYAKLMALANQ